MGNSLGRREFIRTTVAGSAALGLGLKSFDLPSKSNQQAGKIGIIGLDTSHATAFTKELNDKSAGDTFGGFKVVAAYPRGSNDIKSSTDRIPGYTEEVKKYGVEIVNSVEELIKAVDYVLLETNDGRLHLEQAIPVLKAGKRMFIDKPVAASLSDAIAIFNAAEYYKVPIFSASSLRYISGAKEITEGSLGKVLGADTYSPCSLEKTHPDLFWYGIHGVETLFTVMGQGCTSVARTSTTDFDSAVGTWKDGRIGTFRGIRKGSAPYGGTVFCEKGVSALGKYAGYNPLLERIIKFFQDGIPPVTAAETIEIFAFMAAADESKKNGGAPAELEKVLDKAHKKASKITFS